MFLLPIFVLCSSNIIIIVKEERNKKYFVGEHFFSFHKKTKKVSNIEVLKLLVQSSYTNTAVIFIKLPLNHFQQNFCNSGHNFRGPKFSFTSWSPLFSFNMWKYLVQLIINRFYLVFDKNLILINWFKVKEEVPS